MTDTRALLAAAQVARHDPHLSVAHERCRFRAVTYRQNGPQYAPGWRAWGPEPVSGWMSGPELVEWLREAAGRPQR